MFTENRLDQILGSPTIAHHHFHKQIAAYKFYIRPASKVYSDKHLEKELNTIRNIAKEICFLMTLIIKLSYEFNFHENIKKVNHKEMIYKGRSTETRSVRVILY